jgi:hypothetical protein
MAVCVGSRRYYLLTESSTPLLYETKYYSNGAYSEPELVENTTTVKQPKEGSLCYGCTVESFTENCLIENPLKISNGYTVSCTSYPDTGLPHLVKLSKDGVIDTYVYQNTPFSNGERILPDGTIQVVGRFFYFYH